MAVLLHILAFILLLFGSPGPLIGTKSQDDDAATVSDLNALSAALEMHYQRNGEYPTEKELVNEYETAVPGLDTEILLDGSGNFINNKGMYSYEPSECTALGCRHFRLIGTLSDGETYEKMSVR